MFTLSLLAKIDKNSRREEYVNIFNFTKHYPCKQCTAQNTEISPNFLCGKLLEVFKLIVFTKFPARKLGEATIFYAVFMV